MRFIQSFFGLVLICIVSSCTITENTIISATATLPAIGLRSSTPTENNIESTSPLNPQATHTPIVILHGDMGIWVKILEPSDDSIVHTSPIVLRGEASPDTVISINDEIIYIEPGKTPTFSVELSLTEGENIIEILASNGNEETVYLVLTIYYEPSE